MITSERPGVYTSYTVSGILSGGRTDRGLVGVAAVADTGEMGRIYDIASYGEAVTAFGAQSNLTALIRVLIRNGAVMMKAVPLSTAASAADYAAAFAKLVGLEEVRIVICDSAAADVHSEMKSSILNTDARCMHRIGIVESVGTVSELIAAAQMLNCERMVLAAPGAIQTDGSAAVTGSAAAAMAAAVLAESDPAVPMNGAVLYDLDGLAGSYNDAEITRLVRGGVTPLESIGGQTAIVRGVTTRSLTDGTPDATWREINTVLIVDDVIPAVRDTLKRMFARAKNTAQTRDAIRTQVIVELEKKRTAEIIDGYENVAVVQNAEDPTVCDVSFAFTVAHGLNQIRLVAHITV